MSGASFKRLFENVKQPFESKPEVGLSAGGADHAGGTAGCSVGGDDPGFWGGFSGGSEPSWERVCICRSRSARKVSRWAAVVSVGTRRGGWNRTWQREPGRGSWKRSQLLKVFFQPSQQETGTMGRPVNWAARMTPSWTW